MKEMGVPRYTDPSASVKNTFPGKQAPLIGVFDSGVGGLSILRALWAELPGLPVLYMADQVHVPYGRRSIEEVRQYSLEISRWLIAQGVKLIVVACNTASAVALHTLRKTFPDIPFVGMEPAVKPAAEQTHNGKVGVLATPVTFQGELYASVVERFANGVEIMESTCPGLVDQIEAGQLTSPETRRILEEALAPMLAAQIDTVVLGCTHFPFVIPLIEEISGHQVRVIDPSPAVARQARRLLQQNYPTMEVSIKEDPDASDSPQPFSYTRFFTSGEIEVFAQSVQQLLGVPAQVEAVE